jgi:protein SCO1/2
VFARSQGIEDDRWSFLTPKAGAPESLARDFGFAYAAQAGGFDHLAQVTVLDAEGRVFAQVYGENFELPMLVQPLRALALGEPPSVAASLESIVERVRLLCTVYDPASGRYRLDLRLFIELAIGLSCLGLTLGFVIRERRRARRRRC